MLFFGRGPLLFLLFFVFAFDVVDVFALMGVLSAGGEKLKGEVEYGGVWEGFNIVSIVRSGLCEVSTGGLYSSGVACVGGGRVDRYGENVTGVFFIPRFSLVVPTRG